MPDRIATIENLLKTSPDDVFLNYSLAMELSKAERTDEALAAFQRCTELDAEYLPARVESGKTLRAAGRTDEARKVFDQAYTIAQQTGNQHIEDFIRQQLESLVQ